MDGVTFLVVHSLTRMAPALLCAAVGAFADDLGREVRRLLLLPLLGYVGGFVVGFGVGMGVYGHPGFALYSAAFWAFPGELLGFFGLIVGGSVWLRIRERDGRLTLDTVMIGLALATLFVCVAVPLSMLGQLPF